MIAAHPDPATGPNTERFQPVRSPDEPVARRLARASLTMAVRGRTPVVPATGPIAGSAAGATATGSAAGGRGSVWGEAVLAEFEETTGGWEALRWAASGVRISLRERRGGRSLLGAVGAALWHRGPRRRTLVVALATALLAAFANQFVVTVRHVPSISMETTLLVHDRVLVDRVAFRLFGIERGDVVMAERRIVDPTSARSEWFAIRVLGLAGDAIFCRDGDLWRNDALVDEPYLAAGTVTECDPVTVPPGQVYLLGDHREAAQDSRHWGPADATGIVGRVPARVWPVLRIGPLDQG
ncbi:signal peptidase I [Solwaraspora sp. WMMD1047]|uniref:signal peptidase I n=1 Tax=Solwaraspora sp. WMMD1047 TaxID=3016102 RepID=UPI0024177C04|nr:signal peptidase I [Solwaraspora sp. WMMD1047]MDG4832645.1 signal peptidase I [Solwaraspora sp. WMMD1047]